MQRFSSATILVFCGGLIAATSCLEQTKQAPLSVRSLSAEPTALPMSDDMPNNNRLCLVCHLNFAESDSIAGHVCWGITCAQCHGKSIEHMNDESMMTPPDILYGRTEVEAMCRQCHDQPHKSPRAVGAFIEKWDGGKRENGRNVTEDSVCTDCHGLHTVSRR